MVLNDIKYRNRYYPFDTYPFDMYPFDMYPFDMYPFDKYPFDKYPFDMYPFDIFTLYIKGRLSLKNKTCTYSSVLHSHKVLVK